MKHILFMLLCMFGFNVVYADDNAYYGVYRNAKDLYPIEKEFVMMLKPSNPDDLRTAGYAKFNATIIMSDKSAAKERKEIDLTSPIVRCLEQFLALHNIAVAGIEFIESVSGDIVVYDINTNTNYNSTLESKIRESGGEAAADRLVSFLKEQFDKQ